MNSEETTSRFGTEMFPPRKQLIIFLIGWIGFQIFASTIKIVILIIAKIYWGAGEEILKEYSMSMLVNALAYIGLIFAIALISRHDLKKLFV